MLFVGKLTSIPLPLCVNEEAFDHVCDGLDVTRVKTDSSVACLGFMLKTSPGHI